MRSIRFLALLLLSSPASADVLVVSQVAQSFQPEHVTVNVGDTVRWVWSSLSHDVTEGTDGTIDGDEAFHGPLNAANPVFEVTFDEAFLAAHPRTGGRYDYFCTPHFGVGMVGSVTVSDGPGVVYCHCDGEGGWPACGNFAYWGQGCRNSTGSGAELRSHGSAGVAADDLSFEATRLVPGQPALLFAGVNPVAQGAGVSFGDGLRCAGGSLVRLGVAVPDALGTAAWGPGLGAAAGWAPGETRYFQAWYRDPQGGPCGSGFNLSNGLRVDFGA